VIRPDYFIARTRPSPKPLRSATVWIVKGGFVEKQENGGAVSLLSHNLGYDD
jgi:hypothetical protein